MTAKKEPKYYRQLKYGAIGIEMAFSVVAGLLIGKYLDNLLETSPYMTMAWTIAGIVAGFRALIRVARQAQKEEENERD